ncbi:MAG: DUF3553 domain-containing protein [Spirulina sp.]
MVYLAEKYGTENPVETLPPQNVEAEEEILGGCLLDPNAYNRIKDLITDPDMFYISIHRTIWRAISSLGKKGKPTDLMTVTTWLQDKGKLDNIGGTGKLAQLVERCVSAVNIDRYALLLIKKYSLRKLISFGHECIEWGYDQTIDEELLPQLYDRIRSRLEEIPKFSPGQSPRERRYKQYQQKLKEIEDIVLNVEDIAFREELLGDLAQKYSTSISKLTTLYYKSLIGAKNGKSVTLKELKEQYGNDVTEWVVHGLLPKGSATIVHAPGGTGKSLLMYDLLFQMLIGEDWNEFPVLKKQKGLIIQTDETESDLIAHLHARGFTEGMDFKVKTDWSIEFLPQLYKEIQEENYAWIAIDSLTSVSRFSCVDENGVEYAIPILQLNNIASKTNTNILLLHHSNKTDGSARGTSAIQAAVSQVIKLDLDKDSSDDCLRIMTFTKSRARCPGAYRIRLHADEEPGKRRNYWTLVEEINNGSFGQDLNSDWKTLVKQFLKANADRFFYARDIAEAIKGKLDTIRRCLAQLAGAGIIGRKERPGKANLYFLGSPQIPDRDRPSHPLSHPVSQRQNPDTASDTAKPDRVTAKTEEFFSEQNLENRWDAIGFGDKSSDSSDSSAGMLPDRTPDRPREEGDRCDTSPQLSQEEENIRVIVEDLKACENRETYDAIVGIAIEAANLLAREGILCDDLLEAAIARLSPEEQARIESLVNPPKSWEAPADLKKGDRVVAPEHPDWGVGTVQTIRQIGDGLQVHVSWKTIKEDFPVAIEELSRSDDDRDRPAEPKSAPGEPEFDEEAIDAIAEQIEQCRGLSHWEKLQQATEPELLGIAFERATPIKKMQIQKWIRTAEKEKRQLERELNHVNPFSQGDRVALFGSPVSGLGEVTRTHRNQCMVKWMAGETPHYDHNLLKVGQTVHYVGDDPNLKNTFAHPKAGNKYRSVLLTVKGMKEEREAIAIELTRDDWVTSFWVNLCDLKR